MTCFVWGNGKMKSSSVRRAKVRLCAFTALSVVALGIQVTSAHAQQATSSAEREYDFNVPSQSLARTITDIANRAGLQVLYSENAAPDIAAPAVSGHLSASEALQRATAGTGYVARFTSDSVVTLVKLAEGSSDGERVLGAVRVEGAQGGFALSGASSVNGINGSRDVTATEGTGSYTTGAMTIGSKMAASIKEVPRAVSVLTSRQMEDQAITSVTDAMKALPGVIAQGETLGVPTFYSRGFQITAFQIDGGAPLQTNARGNGLFTTFSSFVPNMDMSLYDHVEIIRGAAGTFNGFGNPGGVVNLVRKKPLDHNQLLLEFQAGSFNLHRVSADITGPLAFDGKLRGRLIATHQDNDFFYDIANSNKNVVSATLDYDLTPTTLVSVGASYDEQQMVHWLNGLMRDFSGNLISVSRSTCLCRPGAQFDSKTTEYFGQLEQRIGDAWSLKYKLTYASQDLNTINAEIKGIYNVDPDKNQTVATRWGWSTYRQRRLLQELTLDGSFTAFGMEQKIVAGANYSISKGDGDWIYSSNLRGTIKVDPLNYDPYAYGFDGTWYKYTDSPSQVKQLNAYINADLQIVPRLHALLGVSAVKTSFKGNGSYYCMPDFIPFGLASCASAADYGNNITFDLLGNDGRNLESGKTRISWPPSASLRYDVSDAWSVYATYADIRIEQSSFLTAEGVPLDPVTGGNFEGGIKWSPESGKFNASLSGYYIRQKGFAQQDCHESWMVGIPEFDDYVAQHPAVCTENGRDGSAAVAATNCCFVSDPDRRSISYGVDLEMNGEIRRGWQVSASYTFNRNIEHWSGAIDAVTGSYRPLLGFSPRHLYKFWTSYAFDDASRLRGLSAYAGIQGQSITFTSDSYCPQPVNPTGGCPVLTVPVHYTSPGWVVVNVGGSYSFSPKLSLQLNIDNLFDKSYLATVGGLEGGSWYGSPRNIAVTMRAKF
jgi:outer-membrane receptor for ferric coprogen and ferric-rhodotorulic acid